MDAFAPILGMSMMVVGLIMLLVSFGFLMYGIWVRYRVEPVRRQSDSPGGSEPLSTAGEP